MQSSAGVLFLLTANFYAVSVQCEPVFVRDNTDYLRPANMDKYCVVDHEAERHFYAETDVVFLLYTRSNPDNAQVLKWNNTDSVFDSNFNPVDPTRITVHGWLSNGNSLMHSNIRNAYFAVGEFNMIAVDWGAGAETINYFTARLRVRPVGEIISRMIDTLVSSTGISRDTVYLVGHSLGAHVAGNAGKFQNGQVKTIFGLDPAGPLFALDNDDILRSTDAQYVEHLVTSAGTNGFMQPLGDVSFYANGGQRMPGCGIDLIRNCSHNRAADLFAESVSSSVGFRAFKCESYEDVMSDGCMTTEPGALMGGEPSNEGLNVKGIYRLDTNPNPQYDQSWIKWCD